MTDLSKVYPEPDHWDFEFKHAEPFNRYLGSAILARDGGVTTAKRVGGLRRDAPKNRRLEVWEINQPACLLRLRHLGNEFYFEINYPNLAEEVIHLVENEGWWIDHVAGKKMTKIVPDEHLPDEGYVRPPDSW
jgi:hypothetical protein